MTEIQGVRLIIYDIADKPYFLIVHHAETKTWKFIEEDLEPGEVPINGVARISKEETNLKASEADSLKVAVPIKNGSVNQEVFAVRCNMNSHIIINSMYDTYLWCSQDTVERKIVNGANQQLFERALSIIKDKK